MFHIDKLYLFTLRYILQIVKEYTKVEAFRARKLSMLYNNQIVMTSKIVNVIEVALAASDILQMLEIIKLVDSYRVE